MRTTVAVVLAGLLAACGSNSNSKVRPAGPGEGDEASRDQQRFDREAEAFYWSYLDANPHRGVGLGYHQYDGKLPDVSAAGLKATIDGLKAAERRFAEIPAAHLSRTAQVEREVLFAQIRGTLFDLDVMRTPWRNPMQYMWPLSVAPYVTREYAPLADRARGIIGVCDGAGEYLSHAMDNLEPRLPRTWIATAKLQVNGMIEFIETDVAREMHGLDEATSKQLNESLARCVNAMAEYRDFLDGRMATATDEFALGEELFLRMLRDKEGVDIALDRLAEIGESDLARNTEAMVAAARAIDPERPVDDVAAQVFADKPAIDQVLATASEQAVRMRQFLIDRDIVTIPSDDRAEVRASPPFMRWNFAFLSSAGAFEQEPLPSFYYISPPDPSWPEQVQRAYVPFIGDLLFTTVHELWPGHFLHALHKKANESKILTSFCSYSMSEGWAHYTEEMMWDAGVGDGDPAIHIGQLQNALLRNVRFVSAIGLHTGEMTVEQSQALFESKAYADAGNAQQQAVRGTFDPGYLNYTLGKLMILKLRDDWKAKVGDGYSLRAFHDELLSYGCAPVPVIRRFMLGPDAGPAL